MDREGLLEYGENVIRIIFVDGKIAIIQHNYTPTLEYISSSSAPVPTLSQRFPTMFEPTEASAFLFKVTVCFIRSEEVGKHGISSNLNITRTISASISENSYTFVYFLYPVYRIAMFHSVVSPNNFGL